MADPLPTLPCCGGGCSGRTFRGSSLRCSACTRRAEIAAQERARCAKRDAYGSLTDAERLAALGGAKRRKGMCDGIITATNEHTRHLPEIKARVLKACKEQLSIGVLKELVCCICDCHHQVDQVKILRVSSNRVLVKSMIDRLKPPSNLPDALKLQYDASDLHHEFRGILVARAGVTSVEGRCVLQVCLSCRKSLLDKKLVNPPKFSVANGLFIGSLPATFTDSTFTENAMLNLAQPMHFITVVRGGKHASLRSHAYFFRADPAPPAQLLPRDVVSSGIVGVTMVGAMTPAQIAQTRRHFDVRVVRLQTQLSWYLTNNHLFSRVDQRDDLETVVSAIRTQVVQHSLDAGSMGDSHSTNEQQTATLDGAEELDSATWRHNTPAPAHEAVEEADEICEQVADGIISDFHSIDGIAGIRHVLAKKNVAVHRSSSILSDFDPAFWSSSFCELFPYGRGGLEEPRAVPISLFEYIRYCMRLSSRAHAQHRSFPLVAFDVIARHNALQAVYIKAKMSPVSMEMAASVRREALESYVRRQESRLVNQSQVTEEEEPQQVQDESLHQLFSGISAGMRAFWGSNEERSSDRYNLFAMQLKFGQPSIFFTLSPDSSSSIQIGAWAGAVSDAILEAMESRLQDCAAYSRAKLGQVATSNPYVCAKYYDLVMRVFLKEVLCWDSDAAAPRRHHGLFGQTKAFFAATESQGSTGSLHFHMLIWIENMPSTVAEYYKLCDSARFRTAMIDYVDGIATSNVPVDLEACPKCESGRIEPVQITRRAFQRSRPGGEPTATSKCSGCNSYFGGSDLIKLHSELLERSSQGTISSDHSVFTHIARPGQLPSNPDPGSIASAQVARAILYYQHHHWYHAKSCFKKSKRTPKGNVCRMFMPKEPCPATHWTADHRIEMIRNVGNEYVNAYIPVVNSVFKCNHDVKFLGAGEGTFQASQLAELLPAHGSDCRALGPEKAFYMMKYATKPQQDIENPWTIHLHAYDKSEQRLQDGCNDAAVQGRRRVQSMCCTMTNPHEISAPMASLYLLRGSPIYASHNFVKLHLKGVLQAVFSREEPVDVLLESVSSTLDFRPSSIWQDYRYRPPSLETLNLMTFVAEWDRKKSKCGLRFNKNHPLYASHSIQRRPNPSIVTVIHKRLADGRIQDASSDERLRYRQSLIVLFRPFRSAADFAEREGFDALFDDWWASDASKGAHIFATNNDDYYISRQLAKDQSDADVMRYSAYDGGLNAYDVADEDVNSTRSICSDDDALEILEEDAEDRCDIVWAPLRPTKHIDTLDRASQVSDLAADSTIVATQELESVSMSLADIEQRLRAETPTASNEFNSTGGVPRLLNFPDLPTRVQLLKQAIAMACESSTTLELTAAITPTEARVSDFPTLHDVAAAFKLNEKQQRMFLLAGKNLLASLLASCEPCEPPSQMVGFLGGLPGAGKSRVIAALQFLAAKWQSADAVATAAYQGVAAQAASGQTIHKLFGWSVKSKRAWTPNTAQKEQFSKIKLLILDEISTCDVKILGMVDASLRKLLDRSSDVFGGVHVLLVGDWLQQLPVCGQPSYLPVSDIMPSLTKRRSEVNDYMDRVRGASAYKAVNTVVMLTENMRHQGDPVWRDILNAWRVGRYTATDIDHVNTTAFTSNWQISHTQLQGYCPIIVTSNALRVEFNASVLQSFCARAQVPLHRFPAVVTKNSHPLSPAQVRSLECIRDDKTNGMPILAALALGSIVQCTKNVSGNLKLANGSIGTVVGVTTAEGDVVSSRVINGVTEVTHSLPPDVVFVKLKDFTTTVFLPDLPPGVVPVCKRRETGVTIKMSERSFTVAITQVPLVPAYSLTTEKCQGLTVEKMVLAPLRHSTRRVPQKSSFYVAVTRVKSLRQLYLMAPLTMQFLSYFTPCQHALDESGRLEEMDES